MAGKNTVAVTVTGNADGAVEAFKEVGSAAGSAASSAEDANARIGASADKASEDVAKLGAALEEVGHEDETATITVAGNTDELDAELEKARAQLETFQSETWETGLDVDAADFDEKIATRRQAAKYFGDQTYTPTFDGDTGELDAKLGEAEAAAQALSEQLYEVKVDASDGDAVAKLAALHAQADELVADTYTPRVSAEGLDDVTARLAALQGELDALNDRVAEPAVKLSGDVDALARLDVVNAELSELAGKLAVARVALDGDAVAQGQLSAIEASLERINTNVAKPNLNLGGVADAEAKLAALDARLDAFGAKNDTATVSVDTGNSGGNLDNLKTKADGAAGDGGDGGGLSGLMSAALALGPALATMGVVGGAGIVAIGSAAVTASIGLGAFALAAGADFSKAETQAKTMLAAFQASNQATVFPVIQEGLSLITPALDHLDPLVDTTSHSLAGLEQAASRALGSPYWSRFSDVVAGQAGASLSSLGTFAGDVVKGFSGLDEAFAPLVADVEHGLDSLGARFAAFGASAEGNSGLASFIDYVEKEGPVLISTLGNIASDVGEVFKDLEPLGSGELRGLNLLAEGIGEIAKVSPGLVEAAGAIFSVYKASQLLGGVSGIGNFVKDLGNLDALSMGSGVAAGNLGKLAGIASSAIPSMVELGASLGDIAGPAGLAAAAVLTFTNEMSKGFDTQSGAASSWVKQFGSSLTGLSNPLQATEQEIRTLGAQMDATQQKTNALQSAMAKGGGGTDAQEDKYQGLVNSMESYQDKISGLQKLLPGLASAQSAAAAASRANAQANSQAALAAAAAMTPQKAFDDTMNAVTNAVNGTDHALTALTAAMEVFTGGAAAIAAAEEQTVQGFAALTQSIKTNGSAFEGNSDKAIANQNALGSVANNIDTVIGAMAKQGDSIKTINSYWDENVSRLHTQLQAATGSTGATNALMNQFGLTTGALRVYDAEAQHNVGTNANQRAALSETAGALDDVAGKAGQVAAAIHAIPGSHTTDIVLNGASQTIAQANQVEAALEAAARTYDATISITTTQDITQRVIHSRTQAAEQQTTEQSAEQTSQVTQAVSESALQAGNQLSSAFHVMGASLGAEMGSGLEQSIRLETPRALVAMGDITKAIRAAGDTAIADLGKGVGGPVADLAKYVSEAVTEVNKSLGGDNGLTGVVGGLDAEFKRLLQDGSSSLDQVTAKLAAAQKALAKIKQEAAQNATNLEGQFGIIGSGNDVTTTTTSKGPTVGGYGTSSSTTTTGAAPTTGAAIVSELKADVAALKKYRGLLATLKTWGLDGALMAQLVAAGPTNGMPTAVALVAGGKKLVSQVDLLEGQIFSESGAIGKMAANASIGGKSVGEATAQGIVAGLQAEQKQVTAALEKIAEEMKKAIEEALGIHSPSTVFADVGDNIMAGLAVGVGRSSDLAIKAIADAVQKSKDKALASTSAFSSGGSFPSAASTLNSSSAGSGSTTVKYSPSYQVSFTGEVSDVTADYIDQMFAAHDREFERRFSRV